MGENMANPNEAPIEHKHWCGSKYRSEGIGGQRVAVVGYSHWGDDEHDGNLTADVLSKVIAGEYAIPFFTSIRNYFGFADHADFWHRVVFFNFIPSTVGDDKNRYAWGSSNQTEHASRRFLDIVAQEQPHKAFVLTTKALFALPPTEEQEAGRENFLLGGEFPRKFRWGTYANAHDAVTKVFLLRHPQGARRELMTNAIRRAMSMPV